MTNHTKNSVEQWKSIPHYEGYYEVSDQGRVRSLDRTIVTVQGRRTVPGKALTPSTDALGRMVVNLSKGGKPKQFKVHRLVMRAFRGPCPDGMEVCHNNGDSADNRLENLRYDGHTENVKDMLKHGTNYWANRKACSRGHLFAPPNLLIHRKKNGKVQRACRACHRTRAQVRKDASRKPMFDQIADQNYRDILRGN